MILATTNLKVHSASIVAFRILSATLPCFVWITQKNYTINIFFLIFSDFSMLHTGFSSIKSTWQQRHLIPISGKIFYYFASCICINNTKNDLTRLKQRNLVFTFSGKLLPGDNITHSITALLELACCFTKFLPLFHIWMKLFVFMYSLLSKFEEIISHSSSERRNNFVPWC